MNFKHFAEEIDAIMARDPAARSRLEVALNYPGFHAVLWHRVSSVLWRNNWRVLARFISQVARILTGIEIHPGATIGRRLFIDHGMGVVIGETAEIGDDVTLYQDITLGGISPSVNSAAQVNKKRHPTLRNGVIVGAGAQVLGGITVGEGAKVGANAVVVSDVPAGALAVGIPAKVSAPRKQPAEGDFAAYGLPAGSLPDPVARAIEGLMDQVSRLQARVGMLEGELNGAANGAAHEIHGARPASEATKVSSVETQSGQSDRPESRW
ncbi:MAG TPA: serine O-acetyltransferase [Dongiaceae bacterium]|nr:serine O-acetyltransferase [Dongiaceae bacterium]